MKHTLKVASPLAAPLAAMLLLPACADENAADESAPAAPSSPQDEFWEALSSHCGNAYPGSLVSEDAADADFVGAAMVMHVSACSDERITVPFHVRLNGEWDRSRTWVITRRAVPHMRGKGETQLGLRLKHDHRHEDGEEDELTQYGGDTVDEGTARTQSFPVDQFSIDMFNAQGYEASVTNVWSIELDPASSDAGTGAGTEGGKFVYQLERTIEGGAAEPRLFRVEFEFDEEAKTPPPAWGWE